MARARALCGLLLAASAVSRPAQPMLTYVTLWKDRMKPWGLDPDANPDALSAWLEARGAGVSHVMISASWADVEPKEGAFDLAPLRRLIGKIGQKGLLSTVVLDTFRSVSLPLARWRGLPSRQPVLSLPSSLPPLQWSLLGPCTALSRALPLCRRASRGAQETRAWPLSRAGSPISSPRRGLSSCRSRGGRWCLRT